MALAQLGADVIRVDLPGGGNDLRRWPVTATGVSLYWTNLNKGKRSVTIDFRTPAGLELLTALASAPGPNCGIFLDNMLGRTRLTYEMLRERRADVIHAHVQGHPDGRPALDYTVNAAVGIPAMSGPEDTEVPVNSVLPAWDLLTGMTVATGLLAAVHRRSETGEGSRIDIALADVALSTVGNLGWLAEADMIGRGRPRLGNHVYGGFGLDFSTADGRRVMVVALTEAQWIALRHATGTGTVFAALESALAVDLNDESDRYRLRETIAAVLRPWFGRRTLREVSRELEVAHVLWGQYQDMAEAGRLAEQHDDSLVQRIWQPDVGEMLTAAGPLRWDRCTGGAQPAPQLGADTDAVLGEVLGLQPAELGRLHDAGIVSAAAPSVA